MRKIGKLVILLAFITVANSASAFDCGEPKAFVESVKTTVLTMLTSNASDEEKRTKLTAIFLQVADVNFMGKFALGRSYNDLTPAQQKDYLAAYSNYLSASYVDKFKEFNGQTINVLQVKENGSDFQVDTSIERSGQQPINVTYRIRKVGSCFKIADIIAEGVSLITTERQDFGSVVGQKGADGLIQTLKDKTEQYKNGTAGQ